MWLEALHPDGPAAGALCRRHADTMVVPKGWWLQDRRSDDTLFEAAPPPPPATVYRPKRTRRKPAPEPPRPLDGDGATGAAAEDSWSPTFDTSDDLGGLLAPTTPLLSRAFRK
jgi:hypothetical protein